MNEEQFEKIERYVHEEMNSQERLQFEAELQRNTELYANMEAYRMIAEEMEGYDKEIALKASLQQIGTGFLSGDEAVASPRVQAIAPIIRAHPQYKKSNVWKRWSVAAAIIIATAAGGVWYVVKENNSHTSVATSKEKENNTPAIVETDTGHLDSSTVQPQAIAKEDADKTTRPDKAKKKAPAALSATALFKQHFTPDAPPEDKPAVLEEALNYYEHKAYTDANTAFEDANLDFTTRGQEIPPELTKWYAHYYRGICYLAIDSTGKAITELEQAATTASDSLQAKSQWYLALGYLKGGNIQQTSNLLQQITVNNSSRTYRTKAQSLLTALENSKK